MTYESDGGGGGGGGGGRQLGSNTVETKGLTVPLFIASTAAWKSLIGNSLLIFCTGIWPSATILTSFGTKSAGVASPSTIGARAGQRRLSRRIGQ